MRPPSADSESSHSRSSSRTGSRSGSRTDRKRRKNKRNAKMTEAGLHTIKEKGHKTQRLVMCVCVSVCVCVYMCVCVCVVGYIHKIGNGSDHQHLNTL